MLVLVFVMFRCYVVYHLFSLLGGGLPDRGAKGLAVVRLGPGRGGASRSSPRSARWCARVAGDDTHCASGGRGRPKEYRIAPPDATSSLWEYRIEPPDATSDLCAPASLCCLSRIVRSITVKKHYRTNKHYDVHGCVDCLAACSSHASRLRRFRPTVRSVLLLDCLPLPVLA